MTTTTTTTTTTATTTNNNIANVYYYVPGTTLRAINPFKIVTNFKKSIFMYEETEA